MESKSAANGLNGNKTNQSVRVIRKKTKKTPRNASTAVTANASTSSNENGLLKDASHLMFRHRSWKNSKKSRNGYGRGLPKKGGAGGKGVWGKLGSEIIEVDEDVNDPNYDPESAVNGEIQLKAITPDLTHEEFQKRGEEIILEYFENGDTSEAETSFREILPSEPNHYWIVELAIDIAMDHKPSHRELTSMLISDLYSTLINDKDIAKAFDIMLSHLNDLKLDVPEVDIYLSNFIARAIADDCLPPRYVDTEKLKFKDNHLAMEVLKRVQTLLTMDIGLAHLDDVWGVGGGQRPVQYLIHQMILLLKEYLLSNDSNEAIVTLRSLEVPHFHHEFVYEAILMAIEALKSSTQESISQLLKDFDSACVITRDDLDKGFLRVFSDMPDISVDVPLAYIGLDRFLEMCQARNFLTDTILNNIPARGRKRFVSEGDGGLIKKNEACS